MKILLLGDSLFARHEGKVEPHINFSLKQLIPDLVITNLAESGDNSIDLLAKLAKWDFPVVDKVSVWIGTNDLAIHKQIYLGEFQENMRQISSILLEHYQPSQLIFLGPTPVDENKQRYRTNRLVTYYSEIVEKVAREAKCDFLSVQELMTDSPIPLPELLRGSMDDGLHFGSVGYDLLAEKLAEYIKKKPGL